MKIGDIQQLTGISSATIRYWEECGLLNVGRGANSYREYSEKDVIILNEIKRFREFGIAIADIKLLIDGLIDSKRLLTEHIKKLDLNESDNLKIRHAVYEMLENEAYSNFSNEPFCESEAIPADSLSLGVDIGTTSVSAQLISNKDGRSVHTYCINQDVSFKIDNFPDAFASNAEKLCNIAIGLIKSACETYPNIISVGLTGQMHGIVCLDKNGNTLSPLYTWQNQFGERIINGESICEKIARICGRKYPTGYGLVTYYALKELGVLPKGTQKIACIFDLVLMRLCHLKTPVCHPTNAASLGFYNINNRSFDTNCLNKLGIPKDILPIISKDYGIAGYFEGIPVSYAIGDNQADAFSSLTDGNVLLNIGTSGQICFVSDKKQLEFENQSCEIRPFFGNKFLYSGAVLCGGRALALLCNLILEITSSFGCNPSKTDIYTIINKSALKAKGTLNISTSFSGSRNDPNTLGKIESIGISNFTLDEISYGFCKGIINELYALYKEMNGKAPKQLIISGNALRKNPALRQIAEDFFKCESFVTKHNETAAYGAALYSAVCADIIPEENIKDFIKYKKSKEGDF